MAKKKKYQEGGNLNSYQQFFTDYINNPEYKKRLISMGYSNPDQVIKDRRVSVNTSKLNITNFPSSAINPGIVKINPNQGDIDVIAPHEYSHKGGANKTGLYKNPSLNLSQRESQELINRNNWKQNPNEHLIRPEEAKADIDSLRYLMTDQFLKGPTENIDQKELEKIRQNNKIKDSKIFNRLQERYSDKDLLWLMNNIAQQNNNTSDMAKYGKKAQDGNRIQRYQDFLKSQVTPHPTLPQIPTPEIPLQDYGVKKTDPAADLTAQLGVYNKKKKETKNPMDWGSLATGALLLTDALLPGDPTHNPVIRPQNSYNPHPYGTGSQAIAKHGMTISQDGYKRNSKDKNKPQLRIPSNRITMEGVDFPVLGVSDTGDTQLMLPGAEYNFDGNYVDETPMAKDGLSIAKAKEMLRDGTAHGKKLTSKQKKYFGWIAGGGKAQNGKMVVNPLGNDIIEGTPEERAAATKEAQRIALKQGLMDPFNMQIGARLPKYVDPQGRPYQGTPQRQLPTKLPMGIGIEDIQSEQGVYWYNDPQTGDPIDVDPSVVNKPIFKKNKQEVGMDLLNRQSMASRKQGGKAGCGKKMYNLGGSLSPLSDTTTQINGPSHENGGVPFMGIEAEGGETAHQSIDGSVNIMGNMINPLTGRKFKEDSKRLAEKESKMDDLMDYSIDLVNGGDIKDKWGILKFNSGRIQLEGAARKKAELQASQEHLSTIQQAMLDFSAENNLDPGAFSKGKFVPAKADDKAQNGKKVSLAVRHNNPGNLKYAKWMKKYGAVPGEPGTDGGQFAKFPDVQRGQQAMMALLKDKKYATKNVEDAIKTWTNNQSYKNIPADLKGKKVSDLDATQFTSLLNTITQGEDSKLYNWEGVPDAPPPIQDERITQEALNTTITPFSPKEPTYAQKPSAQRVTGIGYDTRITNLPTYSKPSDARGLSFTQILPELYAAATNQVEPVFMQEYTPDLYQDYEVSFQDRLNENNASFKPIARALGDNPSALATLAGQKYSADSQVLADEFRTNQAIEQDVVNKNISLLNDAELKNLGLADTQFVRQSTAKSKTKAQNQMILNSISDKVAQNTYEQRLLKVYENLYPNYSFGDDYKVDFTGPSAGEAISVPGGFTPITPEAQVTVKTDAKGNVTTTKRYDSPIQQQLKNIQLSTNKLKYNDYFLNQSRRIAKDSRK